MGLRFRHRWVFVWVALAATILLYFWICGVDLLLYPDETIVRYKNNGDVLGLWRISQSVILPRTIRVAAVRGLRDAGAAFTVTNHQYMELQEEFPEVDGLYCFLRLWIDGLPNPVLKRLLLDPHAPCSDRAMVYMLYMRSYSGGTITDELLHNLYQQIDSDEVRTCISTQIGYMKARGMLVPPFFGETTR